MTGTSFDRASGYYDATRALPGDLQDRVTHLLAGELAGRGRCIEIGAGTGRIAFPLHRQGVEIVGIDLSRNMLDQLVAKGTGLERVPAAVADACALPFASATVGAVVACHVLHLVPDWRQAVVEAERVLRPGGVLLVDRGGPAPSPWWSEAVKIMGRHGVSPRPRGLDDIELLVTFASERGHRVRPLEPIEATESRCLGVDLDQWSRQIMAWTWSYRPEQMAAACADIRSWAEASGWPVDDPVEVPLAIRWWAYEAV